MELDKEEYAKLLAKRAATAIKIIKILACVAIAMLAGLVAYLIIVFTADLGDEQTVAIGFIVFMICFFALAAAVAVGLVYANIMLNKLKKLK